MVSIYKLSDPITFEVRYVGQTIRSLEERLRNHRKLKGNSHTNNWIKSLKTKGLKPIIELICLVEDTVSDNVEKLYINYYKYIGRRLTNHEEGGKGTNRSMSEEAKRKLAEINKDNGWRMNTPEAILKRSKTMKGVPKSPEHRAKLSAAKTGKPGYSGWNHTPETKAIMSLCKKGKPGRVWTERKS